MAYDSKTVVKVASLYYKEHMTQPQISKRLKISLYQVSRMLKRALEEKIVQISIVDDISSISMLEEELERKFNLKRAIVVSNTGLSETELRIKLGQSAANFIHEIIKDDDIVGISWGKTMNELVNYLPNNINKGIKVVQTTGGLCFVSLNINCHDIARRFANKFNKEPMLLHAPAMVESVVLKEMLIKEPSLNEVFGYFKKLNIIISGIGNISKEIDEDIITSGYLKADDIKVLRERSVVGDIMAHFIDIDGNICDRDINDRMITIPSEDIFRTPYIIGVAGGDSKVNAIIGAINGKYINIVVTDSITAEKILWENRTDNDSDRNIGRNKLP